MLRLEGHPLGRFQNPVNLKILVWDKLFNEIYIFYGAEIKGRCNYTIDKIWLQNDWAHACQNRPGISRVWSFFLCYMESQKIVLRVLN